MSTATLLRPIMSGIVAPPPTPTPNFAGSFGSPFDYAFKQAAIPDPIRTDQGGALTGGNITIPPPSQPKGGGKPPQEEEPQQQQQDVVPRGSTTTDPFGIKEIRGGGGGGDQTIPMNFMNVPGSSIPGSAPLDMDNPLMGAIGSAMAGPAMDVGMGGAAFGLPAMGMAGANLSALAAMGIHGLGAAGGE